LWLGILAAPYGKNVHCGNQPLIMEELMVQRDTPWSAGTPCWVELSADDLGKAQAFYTTLFGWEAVAGAPGAGDYLICQVQGRQVAGIGPKLVAPEAPSAWMTYLASENADDTAAKITAAGGQVLMAPFDVTDIGRKCVASDPAGATFGVWQAATFTGMQLVIESGAVCWNENMCRDLDGNKAFYQAVFGYQYTDMSDGEFQYATFTTTDGEPGLIGDLGGTPAPADFPAQWVTYFTVDDTDDVVQTATTLGGSIIRPAWDEPDGRCAVLYDDQGAVFAVMALSAATPPTASS
jgi:uncharacterized protein